MKRWLWVLIVMLAAPVAAEQKEKKDTKKPDKTAVTPADLMAQADQKAAGGDVDGAVELLKRAAALEGAGGEPGLRMGRLYEGKYDFDAAVEAYKSAADKLTGASKGEALGRLALIQESRGLAEAAATAQAASTADAAGAWPNIALSRVRAREKKGDEAVELAQKAASAGGGAAAAAALGYAQEARGDLAAAEAAYRGATGSDQETLAAKLGLARVLRKTNRANEAEPILQAVLAAAPGLVEAYKESARTKMALNRASEAMGDASTAAAMAESDADAQKLVQEVTIGKALEYVKGGQADLAVQDLTALRDKNPDMPEARVGLAKALVAKRQADPALTELQKAVELKPDLAEAQYQLGYVKHVMKNDAAGAVPALEKAVAAEPGNTEYRTALGAALSDAKQYDRALAELTKVTESPGYHRAEAWIYLGRAYVATKRYKEAIAPLEKAASIAPNSPDAAAWQAWAYFGLKDAANFKKQGAKARSLGYKEATLLQYLTRVEAGEPIK
jgi:tetratricopeptide (TPR) repeat protein